MRFQEIVLGSGSKVRRDFLAATGLAFRVMTAEVDETGIHHSLPRDMARLRSYAKGLAVAKQCRDALIVSADQTLGFQDEIFHKVATPAAAAAKLRRLSGQTHTLFSAFSLFHAPANAEPVLLAEQVVPVPMSMRPLTEAEIEAYVATGEWRGCVGCYQCENRGRALFSAIGGEISAVIGLPLTELLCELRSLGINSLTQPKGPWRLP